MEGSSERINEWLAEAVKKMAFIASERLMSSQEMAEYVIENVDDEEGKKLAKEHLKEIKYVSDKDNMDMLQAGGMVIILATMYKNEKYYKQSLKDIHKNTIDWIERHQEQK